VDLAAADAGGLSSLFLSSYVAVAVAATAAETTADATAVTTAAAAAVNYSAKDNALRHG